MFAAKGKTKRTQSKKRNATDDHEEDDSDKSLPPWKTHFQHTVNGVKTPYKVGDTKTWKGQTYYFCDCPNHRDRIKWHTFPAETCRTRKRWLERKKKKKVKTEANEGVVEGDDKEAPPQEDGDAPESTGTDSGTPPLENTDVTTLLATAMNLLADNPTARDLVADALNVST